MRNLARVDEMRAPVAFLRHFELGVPVHRAERAQIHELARTLRRHRVDTHEPILALAHDVGTRFDQRT